jgi:ferredoxin
VLDLVDPETGEATYQLAPSVVGFLEISVLSHAGATERRLAAAIDAYMHGDDTFARELSEAETVVGRALVHETTIDEDDLPEVLDWERATSLIDNARSIALLRCSCRQKAQYLEDPCDVPIERCIAIGAGADFVIRHGMGRGIEPAQAKDVLAASRADNLVQIADNVQQHPTFICNCCPCHCALLGDATKFGFAAVAPSAFVADPPLVGCRGCSRCSRSCPVGAITMASGSTGDERKSALVPVVDPDLCIGCGTCSDVCHRHAMHMSMKTARPQVPINAVERVVRMSLERGRLADLLFDASKNRSSRYLNGVVHAVCRLSPVDRLLATEQVRSRFVRYAMKNFEPPV